MQRKWIPVPKDENADPTSFNKEDVMDLKKNPKLLNAVIVASNLAKGVYRKPDKENDDHDDDNKVEKGTKK